MTIEIQQTSKEPVKQTGTIKLALEAFPKASKEVEAMQDKALKEFTAVFSQPLEEVKEKNNGVPTADGATTKDETKQELKDLKEEYAQQGKELTEARKQVETVKKEIDKVNIEFSEEKNKHSLELSGQVDKTTEANKQVTDLTKERDEANAKEQTAKTDLANSENEHTKTKAELAKVDKDLTLANQANLGLTSQLKDKTKELDKALAELKPPTVPPVDPAVITPPSIDVTVNAKVNADQVKEDLAKVEMMVSQFKEPAWRLYAGAKLVGTIVSTAGVIAGVTGSLAMGLDPSLGAIACLAAPVIKYTIDRICNEERIGPFQETINATLNQANKAESWVKKLIPIKALINMVEKFKDSNVPEQREIVRKLRTVADRITTHINQQHPFEPSKEKFPVSQKQIQDLKWAGTDVSRLINSVFYVGAIASNCLFYNEMVAFGNTIAAWGWVVELKDILIK